MRVKVQRTPKTIANWSGLGKLFKDADPVAQIEYGVHVWKDQEPVLSGDGLEITGSYFGSGRFTTVGYDPENIEAGEELLLEFSDGKRLPVTIVSYGWGQGTFQLVDSALGQVFDSD